MNAPAKKAAPEITTVVMADGRAVDFSGKRRLQKEAFQHEDGSVSIRLARSRSSAMKSRVWKMSRTWLSRSTR
jgi:predicted DNA binding CopG/RHH family protein